MRPTDVEIIEAVASMLRDRVAPLVADQPRVAAELRSADALLALVVARLTHADAVLAADASALDDVLARLVESGVPVPLPDGLDAMAPDDADIARRSALEAAIHLIHDGRHPDEVALVRRHLIEAARREQVIYGATTGRRLF